jgi:ribosomal protein S18 acetylase RimI-like enzyme
MGGFALAAFDDDDFIGALVMNKTGMSGYIPENILVYVAVHRKTRGKGYGGEICKKSFELADGDVKLHVEYDNPAKRLYERIGMVNKYAEMRYYKNK